LNWPWGCRFDPGPLVWQTHTGLKTNISNSLLVLQWNTPINKIITLFVKHCNWTFIVKNWHITFCKLYPIIIFSGKINTFSLNSHTKCHHIYTLSESNSYLQLEKNFLSFDLLTEKLQLLQWMYDNRVFLIERGFPRGFLGTVQYPINVQPKTLKPILSLSYKKHFMEIRGFSTICHDPLTRLLFNQVNQNITWASNFIKVSIWIFVLHVLPNTLEYNISLLVNKEFLHFFFDLICKYSAKALLLFLFLFHWTRQPKRLFFVKPATFSTIKVTQWLRNFCWFGNPGQKLPERC